jgi:hypothetical protein
MGLAEDLKALQELRDKGELSESAYVAARDAAIGKQTPPVASVQGKPMIGKPVKALIAFLVLFVGFGIFIRILNNPSPNPGQSSRNLLHLPITVTDEVQNVPANSWKALNYNFPSGGKVDITVNVVNGNPIDIYLANADQLDAMKNGEWQNVKVYSAFNAVKTRTYHRTQQIGPGNYYFVLRDTSLGVLSAHASDVSVKTILTP